MSTNNIYVIDLVEEKERTYIENSNNQNHHFTSRNAFNQINRPVTNTIVDFIYGKSFYLEGLLGIAIIVTGSILTLSFTCWPQHNVILNPEYWYEPMISFNVITMFVFAAFAVEEAKVLLNAKKILSIQSFLLYYLLCILGSIIFFLTIYYLWVIQFEFPYPMPRTVLVQYLLITFLISPLCNWVIFPSNLKTKGTPLRRKIFAMTVLNWLRMIMTAAYAIIPSLPFVKHKYLQLFLGIIYFLFKNFNMKWNSKFTLWAFDMGKEDALIENIIFVGCNHSFSLTIALGNAKIHPLTAYLLISIETIMNGWNLRKIIRLHQQGTAAANDLRDKSLNRLALKEFSEILIPSIYCLSYIGSYFGPNYDIMGGIGLDLWHHEKISSLYEKLEKIVIFAFIESLRGIMFTLILWKLCRLNMYSAYCNVIRNYGWYILFCAAQFNQAVSANN